MLFHNYTSTSQILYDSPHVVLDDFEKYGLPTKFETATIITSSKSAEFAVEQTESFAKIVAGVVTHIKKEFDAVRVDVSQSGGISVISDWVWGF